MSRIFRRIDDPPLRLVVYRRTRPVSLHQPTVSVPALPRFRGAANEKGVDFTQISIASASHVVVAIPEGLPLAVTLTLAFATKRTTAENLLVRVLGLCETMANASVVRIDKTEKTIQNIMSVVAGSIGVHAKFVRDLKENKALTNAPDQDRDQPQEQDVTEAADGPHGQVTRKVDEFFGSLVGLARALDIGSRS